jgi:hypothetical protein
MLAIQYENVVSVPKFCTLKENTKIKQNQYLHHEIPTDLGCKIPSSW